jgi:tetratricopeptide (TPR) repeat protein
MQVLEDMTKCDDSYKADNLANKRKELAERLAMSYLTYGKELEADKYYEDAVDVYSKALKALENISDADQRLLDRIAKVRGVALSKKIEFITNAKNKQHTLNASELSYYASVGETKYFGSQGSLSKNIRIGRGNNTAYTSKPI